MAILHQVHIRSGKVGVSDGDEEFVSEELIGTFWKSIGSSVNGAESFVFPMGG